MKVILFLLVFHFVGYSDEVVYLKKEIIGYDLIYGNERINQHELFTKNEGFRNFIVSDAGRNRSWDKASKIEFWGLALGFIGGIVSFYPVAKKIEGEEFNSYVFLFGQSVFWGSTIAGQVISDKIYIRLIKEYNQQVKEKRVELGFKLSLPQ
jgi:hypothetical protein